MATACAFWSRVSCIYVCKRSNRCALGLCSPEIRYVHEYIWYTCLNWDEVEIFDLWIDFARIIGYAEVDSSCITSPRWSEDANNLSTDIGITSVYWCISICANSLRSCIIFAVFDDEYG
jgi:hypothetical protein